MGQTIESDEDEHEKERNDDAGEEPAAQGREIPDPAVYTLYSYSFGPDSHRLREEYG